MDQERVDAFAQLSQLLLGDGGYEAVAKKEMGEKERKLGYAIHLGSAVAGPAAMWQAVRAAKHNEGGIPRQAVGVVARKSPHSRAGKTADKVVSTLKGRKGRIGAAGAAAAGAGLVAVQGLNYTGDLIALRALKKKPDTHVTKSSPDPADLNTGAKKTKKVYLTKGTLTAMAAEKTADVTVKGVKAGTPVVVDTGRKIHEKVRKADDRDLVWEGEFSKFDTDKRQVFGWASIVEVDGKPVVDLQGDYITPDEIEKAAYTYVQKSRKGGDMHRRDGDQPVHVSDMIESFMVTPEKKQAMGLPDSVPTGWWVGFQVNDEDTWNLVKSDKRTGFSIHGRGKRVPVNE